MKSILRAAVVATLAVALVPGESRAAEPEKVVVRNRKFTSDGKLEASVGAGFTMVNFLTDHTNLRGSLGYNLGETLALELGGGYALSKLTNVADAASSEVAQSDPTTAQKIVSDFEDLWRMSWNAELTARWAPIYGKLNLAAELPIHFQAYLMAGGGAGGMVRDSLVYCVGNPAQRKQAICTPKPPADYDQRNVLTPMHQSAVKPLFIGGGGMRFFVTNLIGLRLEVRDMAFPDSYRVKIPRKEAEADAGAKTGQPAFGEEAGNPGFTHLVFFNISASFLF